MRVLERSELILINTGTHPNDTGTVGDSLRGLFGSLIDKTQDSIELKLD